jgi:hypothetical protein
MAYTWIARIAFLSKVMADHSLWVTSSGREGCRARLSKDMIIDQPMSAQDYSFVDFGDFDLARHPVELSNFSYADLSKSTGLTEEKLARTNLRGALLPSYIKDFTMIAQIAEASKNANTILLTFLAAVLFTILTVFQTSDAALFVNSSGAKLPVVQVDLPVAFFTSLRRSFCFHSIST